MCSSMDNSRRRTSSRTKRTKRRHKRDPKKKDVVLTHTFAKATNSSRRRDPKEWRCSTQIKNIALFNFKLGPKPNYPDLLYYLLTCNYNLSQSRNINTVRLGYK